MVTRPKGKLLAAFVANKSIKGEPTLGCKQEQHIYTYYMYASIYIYIYICICAQRGTYFGQIPGQFENVP